GSTRSFTSTRDARRRGQPCNMKCWNRTKMVATGRATSSSIAEAMIACLSTNTCVRCSKRHDAASTSANVDRSDEVQNLESDTSQTSSHYEVAWPCAAHDGF